MAPSPLHHLSTRFDVKHPRGTLCLDTIKMEGKKSPFGIRPRSQVASSLILTPRSVDCLEQYINVDKRVASSSTLGEAADNRECKKNFR